MSEHSDKKNGFSGQEDLQSLNQQLQAMNEQLCVIETELSASRARYINIFDGMQHAIIVYKPINNGDDFVIAKANPASEDLEGFDKDEIVGKSIGEVVLRSEESGLVKIMRKVLSSDTGEEFLEAVCDGRKIKKWYRHYIFCSPAGRIIDTYEDVTEKKRAHDIVAEEHNLLRSLIDHMPDYIYVKDTESQFVVANSALASDLGFEDPEAMTGSTDHAFFPDHLANQYYRDERNIIETSEPLINREEPLMTKDGINRWLLTTKVPLRDNSGDITGVIGIGRDITEKKRLEEKLAAAYQQLAASEQQLKAANQQLKATNQQLGASEQQLKATNQQLTAANQQLGASEQQLKAANQQLTAANQQLRAANQQLGASEQQLKATNQQLRATEMSLRSERDKLSVLFEGLSRAEVGINVIDENFNVHMQNSYLDSRFGQASDQLCYERYAGGDERCSGCPMLQPIEEDRVCSHEKQGKDGRYYMVISAPLHSSKGDPDRLIEIMIDVTGRRENEQIVMRSRDELERRVAERTAELSGAYIKLEQEIAERKRQEQMLRETEKLAAAGRLAARIAHEINNPLAGIKNSFLLIKDAIPEDYEYYKYVGLILKEISRVSSIVRQMYDLYRPIQEMPREFQLSSLVYEVSAMLQMASDERAVNISVSIDKNIIVYLPGDLIRQVLFNVVQNAIEASDPNSNILIGAESSGDSVIIKVCDSGHGMDVETREKIFEPFFTTKSGDSNGGGLGLGLSVCKGIIEALRGDISVQSELNKGTEFAIEIPFSEGDKENDNG